jgi:hypothetical protein
MSTQHIVPDFFWLIWLTYFCNVTIKVNISEHGIFCSNSYAKNCKVPVRYKT